MIKGLYFKLNMDNAADKAIYNFFIRETKEKEISKIRLLYRMMCLYNAASNDRIGGLTSD